MLSPRWTRGADGRDVEFEVIIDGERLVLHAILQDRKVCCREKQPLVEVSCCSLGYRHGGTRPAVCGVRSEILLRHLSSVVYRDLLRLWRIVAQFTTWIQPSRKCYDT